MAKRIIYCERNDDLREEGRNFLQLHFPDVGVFALGSISEVIGAVRMNHEDVDAIITGICEYKEAAELLHEVRSFDYTGPVYYLSDVSKKELSVDEMQLFTDGVSRTDDCLERLVNKLKWLHQRPDKARISQQIGYCIVQAREQLGFSVHDLAKYLAPMWSVQSDLASRFIHGLEQGKNILQLSILPKSHSVQRIQRITDYMRALGCDDNAIMGIFAGIEHIKPSFFPSTSTAMPYPCANASLDPQPL